MIFLSHPQTHDGFLYYCMSTEKTDCAKVFILLLFDLLLLPLGHRRDKTCFRGYRQSETQTSLLSYRDYCSIALQMEHCLGNNIKSKMGILNLNRKYILIKKN